METAEADVRPEARSLDALKRRCHEERDGDDFYRLWRAGEHWLGPSFRVIRHLWRRDGEALARLELPSPEVVRPRGVDLDLGFLMNACIGEVYGQALMPAVPDYEQIVLASDYTFIGQGVDRSWDYTGAVHRATYCHAVLRDGDGESMVGDMWLYDDAGSVLAAVHGLRIQRMERALIKRAVLVGARRARRRAAPREELFGGPPEELRRRLEAYLVEQVADVVGAPPSSAELHASLSSLGMDSLRAVELQSRVQADLGVEVPLAELLQESTLSRIAFALSAQLQAQRPSSPEEASTKARAAAPPTPSPDRGARWIRRITEESSERPRVRLFCFPHAGAGASAYRSWQKGLPPDVEVCAVQLPGREERLGEPAFNRLEPLLDALVEVLEPLLDSPFAFFGASMGALVAFELTRALRRRGAPGPSRLLVAAYPAPHLPNPLQDVEVALRSALEAPDPAAAKLLHQLGVLPAALVDPEAAQIALPALRADLELVPRYVHREEAPLSLPISAFGGQLDARVPRDALLAWSRHTDGAFQLEVLPGPHLFYQTEAQLLLGAIARVL